jgi:hypothetical protein
VCTRHCTVQCPVHRQPRAQILFSCALSGGSPDSYCALSSVHRTCTVDCLVRPYRVLKNRPPARAEPDATLLLCSLAPSALWRFALLAGDLPLPTTVLRRPPVLVPALLLSVSSSTFLSSLSLFLRSMQLPTP